MHELLRTSDPVLVSFVEALLREQSIDYHVADSNTSAVEGSIGIFPRRILVAEASAEAARTLLIEAGLAGELPDMAPDLTRPARCACPAGGSPPARPDALTFGFCPLPTGSGAPITMNELDDHARSDG